MIRPKGHMGPFDGIRGIGILSVIMFHALMGICSKIPRESFQVYLEELPFYLIGLLQADKAVDAFFVLSGFLIGIMLMKEHTKQGAINLKRFYGRRFLRLMPVYYTLILILFLIPTEQDKIYLLTNLLYINNFIPHEGVIAGWTWSLAVEEQFYFLFPILVPFLLIKVRRKWLAFLVLAILSLLIRYVLLLNHQQILSAGYVALMFDGPFFTGIYDNLYSRYGALLAGITAAYYHVFYPRHIRYFFERKALLSNIVLAFCIAVMIAIYSTPVAFWIGEEYETKAMLFHLFHRNVFSMALSFVILSTLYGKGLAVPVNAIMSARFWYPMGQITYSAYLFNPGFCALGTAIVAAKVGESGQYELSHLYEIFAIATLGTFAFSLFTFLFIEKPFMNMRNVYGQLKAKAPVIKEELGAS
jgi:peptidoglycan/LPS O-acetylase OafA/YrhL